MSLLSPGSMGNPTTTYVWNLGEGNIREDCKEIVNLCKNLLKDNKIVYIQQVNSKNKISIYVRLIELLGRYGLYNIKFVDVPLTKFSLKAIALMKNRAFASYWLFYFLNNEGSIVKGDVRQLQRLVTLLFVIKPRGLDYFGLSKGSVIVRYNGRLYSLETTVNSWDQNNLPSFSIITKDQNVRFYLVQPGVNFSGHASKLKLQNLRNFVCTYQAKEYIYDARVQRMLSPVMLNNNRLLLMPKGANSDLIFLSEIREYLNKYGYDDPSKGFGTRMFYVDEAPLINKGLYPSSANSVRIMTIISKDEVALHSTSSKFLKKNVGELVNYGTTMARVPRMFILSLERIDQLINSHIISIQM